MNAIIIQNTEEIASLNEYADAYILPLQDFSINYPHTFNLEDIKKVQNSGKEVFVIVNKNIHNNELEKLKKVLLELDKLKLNGLFFYDIAVLTLKNKLKLKTPLVWSQEHLTTNYQTVNFWYDKGVQYAYLSSELSKTEIEEISKHSKAILFANIFGYQPMFTSRRHLVKNYLKYFRLESKNQNKKITKEGKGYPIIDQKNGTTVYSNYILNVKEALPVKYLVYNTALIDDVEKIFKTDFPLEQGFLDKEIIYKVRKK